MKIKKYTVPTIHRKKVGIGKFDIPHTNKHYRSWLSRSISIKSDGVKLVYSRFFLQHCSYLIKTIETIECENRAIFARRSGNGRATVSEEV